MSLKHYTLLRLTVAAALAMFIAMSTAANEYLLPIVAVAAAFVLLFFLRRHVREIMADERDIAIGGTAARWAIHLFSLTAVLLMFTLLALQERNDAFAAIAYTLAYSTCGLMLLYSIIFKILYKRMPIHA